jgi:hypothetical protein
MNSNSKPERLAAVSQLINSYKADPLAIDSSIELITMPQLESLSSSGRINVLVFLRNTEPLAWNKESVAKAESAIDEIKSRAEVGKVYIGPQTQDALSQLEQLLGRASHDEAVN